MAQNPDLHLWRAVLVAGLPFLTRGGYAMVNAYGAALNEGRALFASNELFGQWLVSNNLSETVQAERAAAMWAAAKPDEAMRWR